MKTSFTLLAAISALLLIGCYAGHPRGYGRGPDVEASYRYVYYPDAEVYYAPERHVYYWSDGGAWRSGPQVPPTIVLHSHVTVNLKSPEPYRHHEEVRAQHPRRPEEKQRERGPQDHDGR